MSNGNTTTASRKLIASWSAEEQVGIWIGKWSVRLYEDRAIIKIPYVKWANNSGSYAVATHRVTGRDLDRLLKLAAQEREDDADYTEDAHAIICDMDCNYR